MPAGDEFPELSALPEEIEEIEVRVTLRLRLSDWEALRAQARQAVAEAEPVDLQEQADRLEEVDAGPFGALAELLDPDVLVVGIDGVEALGAIVAVGLPGDGDEPDFSELFPLDEVLDDGPGGWLLTPRTAAVLHTQLVLLGSDAREELEELGDDPVEAESDSSVFGALPELTWRQDAIWRDRFIGALDALAGDLAEGDWPRPRCPAEEFALHIALLQADDSLSAEPGLIEHQVAGLPVHPYDYDWNGCRRGFFQDEGFLRLYDADPASPPPGYRPEEWFRPFGNLGRRDLD
ncbi:hypothetical protein [Streptacidiphilus monticola]|jgi:hypothetical protein|uniref:DUF4261 domain-containing protein n=1 Tax=Streptacidiphilus monticola TaxID=2161674 RepID=A0ABW1G8X8_9ACTN